MRVAIRVDASAAIGTGHVKRCLSLADALVSAGAAVRFVCRELGIDYGAMLGETGMALTLLDAPSGQWTPSKQEPPHAAWAGVDWTDDADHTIAACRDWLPDWIVVDHYAFDSRWHDRVRAETSARILVIDDTGDRLLSADILVDHNPDTDHRAKYKRSLETIGRLLAGPRFALLGPRYSEMTPIEIRPEVRSIGMFMGGVDAGNHSALALAACREAGFAGPVEIVTTSANPNLAELERIVAADGGAEILRDLPDLIAFLTSHDLQIGAGGGATWERCRAGVPAIVLATAQNQEVVVDALRQDEAAVTPQSSGKAALAKEIALLVADYDRRRHIAANAGHLVDGRGCERVALSMAASELHVRPASESDAATVHCWRNAPATRAVSVDPAEIAWESHVEWFKRSLASPDNRRILIGTIGKRDVGVVRFDMQDDDQWEVSIFLDPDLTGLGLGPPLLLAAEAAHHAALP
ncbi:MAG: UDP-2,4-diacetamido-2,4,6-trideoxy-beta-L-altropyranose hydrolase, partial [Novosphingobium sp.]|nr:UDP-2,4-diacetamido-2,4,6-trideoxy-beta-L-altropyranose hydrolase [Novosphingobium sp.]